MRLNEVSINGYRSLYEVQISPGDLTVLTGPNNSGKTNFVEAIQFLAEVYRDGLEVAIISKGGIENIIHRRMARTRRSLSFSSTATLTEDEFIFRRTPPAEEETPAHRVLVQHHFVAVPQSQRIDAEYRVSEERVAVRLSERSDPVFTLTRIEQEVKAEVSDSRLKRAQWLKEIGLFRSDFYEQFSGRIRPTELLYGLPVDPIEATFKQAMGNMRLYQLVPLEGRKAGVPTPNAEVDTHGQNLPALVWFLRKNDRDAWGLIMEAMQRIVPDLQDIKTEFTPDRRLALQFVERGVRRPWSAEDISDGTIQALGMYTAIFDARASLILFEEPENSVHPWIIRNFVDACREASTERQIILTTHSPALLSYLNPKEISLVWKRGGRTNIKPLLQVDPSAEEMWNEGQISLFDMLDSGLLPETVPGGEG